MLGKCVTLLHSYIHKLYRSSKVVRTFTHNLPKSAPPLRRDILRPVSATWGLGPEYDIKLLRPEYAAKLLRPWYVAKLSVPNLQAYRKRF